MSRPVEERLLDAADLDRLIERLADAIADSWSDAPAPALVGVRSRGVPITERLLPQIARRLGRDPAFGSVDVTMYRDDYGTRSTWPILQGTDLPFTIDDAEIVLVDDVLFTGRTTRAALNALCDVGRPHLVRLAVVVERPGHELPIRADFIGTTLTAAPDERIELRIPPIDPEAGVFRVKKPQ